MAYIAVTCLLYELLKPVNRSISLLAAFFSMAGCIVGAFGSLFTLAPLTILEGTPYLSVFKMEQLQAMALLSLNLSYYCRRHFDGALRMLLHPAWLL